MNISATPPAGQQFKNWTGSVSFANANSASTSFTMPANAVTVTANFEDITSNEVVTAPSLKAWTHNGVLYVSGLMPGAVWSVYSVSGALIYAAAANGNEAEIPLFRRGVYIIITNSGSCKVVY